MTHLFSRRRTLALMAAAPSALSLTACETLDPGILDGIVGGQDGADGVAGLSGAEVALGLKAALDNGIGFALNNLGRTDGYFGNSIVRIPLPKALQDVRSVLAPIGADGLLSELELKLNRGAEAAAPVARDIFVDAVRGLTIQDAFSILRGPETAATDYLRERTSGRLAQLFSPILENALQDTGALSLLDQVDQQMTNLPYVSGLGASAKTDLINHGVDYGLRGVFHFIAEEEAAIRRDPARRTSEILRRVFR